MKLNARLLDNVIVADLKDNVATARVEISAGTAFVSDQWGSITVKEKIPFGYKLALKQIAKGEPIIKYGQKIGIAKSDIVPGELVHVHNVSGERGRGK